MTGNLTAEEKVCEHTKVFVTDSTMRRMQVPCPWCKDDEIKRLTRERDQYKQIAELNAETIANMKKARRDRLRSLIPETSHE